MTNCLQCDKKLVRASASANNHKYCSITCRNKADYARNNKAEKQRIYLEKKRVERYPQLIQCQYCGRHFRQIGSHVYMVHKQFARDYRIAIGKDVKRGMLTDDLRELKASQVFENGTVENLKAGETNWFKPGDPRAGKYVRSPETMERLKRRKRESS